MAGPTVHSARHRASGRQRRVPVEQCGCVPPTVATWGQRTSWKPIHYLPINAHWLHLLIVVVVFCCCCCCRRRRCCCCLLLLLSFAVVAVTFFLVGDLWKANRALPSRLQRHPHQRHWKSVGLKGRRSSTNLTRLDSKGLMVFKSFFNCCNT